MYKRQILNHEEGISISPKAKIGYFAQNGYKYNSNQNVMEFMQKDCGGGRKHPDQKMIPVNTKNILFICGGAFDGIEKKIAQRLSLIHI